jgi:PAS domain S-box-containing protein
MTGASHSSNHSAIKLEYPQLAQVLELTHEVIIIADARGTITYVNQAFNHSSGYTPEEVIGRSPAHFLNLPNDTFFLRDVLETFNRNEVWSGPLSLRHKDGSAISLKFRITPTCDSEGQHKSFIGIGRDVTREKQLQRQVEEFQRLESLGTLANGIAHRFNNLLAAISGQTELLLMTHPEASDIHSRLQKILQAVGKGRSFVSELNIFSSREKATRRPIDLAHSLKHAISFMGAVCPSNVQISSKIPESLPKIIANADELHQVIVNLMSNAMQAMKAKGGRLSIDAFEALHPLHPESTHSQPSLCIQVSDTGIGIPDDVRHRIFEPFFSTNRIADASGMGLAIAHGIVQRHGGLIEFNTAEGNGSEFRIFLPLYPLDSNTVDSPSQPEMLHMSGQVLLADDDHFSRKASQQKLEQLGLTVMAFADITSAVNALEERGPSFSIIITDLKLGDSTGYDLAAFARVNGFTLPIVLCPKIRESVDWYRAELLKIDKILYKPCPMDEFVQTIRSLVLISK